MFDSEIHASLAVELFYSFAFTSFEYASHFTLRVQHLFKSLIAKCGAKLKAAFNRYFTIKTVMK